MGPGIAIAERLTQIDSEVEIAFLCSDRPVDRRMLQPDSWDFTPMPASVPSIRPIGAIRFAISWSRTRRLARRAIGTGPHVRVVSLGGFVAPPVVAAASSLGVPVDLLNLDVVAGRANRWVARRATRVLTAVETDLPRCGSPLGMPLRRAVQPIGSRTEACRELGLDPGLRTLLVTGASQGARTIDRFMSGFAESHGGAFEGWQVLHLASERSQATLVADYANAGVPHLVLPFLEKMGLAWNVADLAISRGGASSVAEIACSRTPAIILPYPWHRDRHQARNAEVLVDLGLAEIVDDPGDGPDAAARLAARLRASLEDPEGLDRRRDDAGPSTEDAALIIARMILDPDSRPANPST